MGVESVDIEFRARLDDFKKTLETIPGLTKKSARELTSAWTSEIKKAEKQGGDSIQAAAKEAEKLEKIATAIGGPIGDGIRQIGALAKGAGAGLGEMGTKMLAIGATAAVVMAAGYAVGSVLTNIEAYDGAVASLEARDLVTDEQVSQLHAASAGWEALGNQASGFAVIVATKVSKSFMDFQVGAAAAIGFLQDGLDGAARAARELADAQAKGAAGFSEQEKLLKSVSGWSKRLQEQEKRTADARAAAIREDEAAAAKRRQIADAAAAQREKDAAAAKQLADEAAADQRRYDQLVIDLMDRKHQAFMQYTADLAKQNEAQKANVAAVQEMKDAFAAAGEGVSMTLDNLGKNIDKMANQNKSAAMATAADWANAQDQMQARSSAFAGAVMGLADVISNNQAAHLDRDSAAYRKNRKKQFAAHKAAAIAEATINTALSVTKTLSQYAYPVNIVLGALSLAAGVATIATIAAQKPQFYTGGLVSAAAHANQQADAVDATLHDGEGVLTRRGVAAMGGAEGVRAVNAGQPLGGASVVAVSMLDSRILGDVWSGSGPRGTGGLMARVDSRLHGGLPGRAPPRSR